MILESAVVTYDNTSSGSSTTSSPKIIKRLSSGTTKIIGIKNKIIQSPKNVKTHSIEENSNKKGTYFYPIYINTLVSYEFY